ncbi:hypothetical protein B0H11DRAFT_2345577 [Mycena galericulata]|nr:hypothetical protein B0H11DRAFT_2345577 [Mycena galericulata]
MTNITRTNAFSDPWSTIDLNYPSVNNVLAVANIIPANDNVTVPVPPVHACVLPSSPSLLLVPTPHSTRPFLFLRILSGWLHYILTFVNITNIRRLRYQLRLIHRCRAQLRLCVCDRYGGEWNRDRRGRECDRYGRTWEWDGGLERGVGVCVSASSFFPSIISLPPSHKLTGSPPSTSPIVNARATLRARHQFLTSPPFIYDTPAARTSTSSNSSIRADLSRRAALPSCRLIKVNIFMVR